MSAESRPSSRFVYLFGGGKADGNEKMKNLLGGKGANLAEMVNFAVPVPPLGIKSEVLSRDSVQPALSPFVSRKFSVTLPRLLTVTLYVSVPPLMFS